LNKWGFFFTLKIVTNNKIYLSILLIFILNSCAIKSFDQRVSFLNQINQNEFSRVIYQNDLDIFSLQRINNSKSVIIYIEGDGLSWIDRFTPSSDPTPMDPIAFKLAKLDQNPNVIYLGRPCQYIKNNQCRREIWTKLQYSKLVMVQYEEILKEVLKNHSEAHLIGYSGGSVVAMYLASIEGLNIKSVRTIVGNIDPNKFTNLLNLSSYQTSINLDQIDDKIKSIPQIHYYGDKDQVIPKEIHLNYQNKYINNSCIKTAEVKASHIQGWEVFWKNNYNFLPDCY